MLYRKAVDLAKNNDDLVLRCLQISIRAHTLLLPKTLILDKVNELQNLQSPRVNTILGNYYLKHEKVCLK